MRAVDLQQLLSLQYFTAPRVDDIAGQLRSLGMLPKGGRGLNSPSIDTAQQVYLILAVAGSDRVVDAPMVARTLGSLRDKPVGGTSLFERIAAVLAGEDRGEDIAEIHLNFSREHSTARIVLRDGVSVPFRTSEAWEQRPIAEALWQGYCGRIGIIGGALLRWIADSVADEEEGELVAG